MSRVIDLGALPPGKALRVQRALAGLTQAELAERLGTYPARIGEAERDLAHVPPYLAKVRERLAEELRAEQGASA